MRDYQELYHIEKKNLYISKDLIDKIIKKT